MMGDYSPPQRLVDVHGDHWRYTGFKPVQDLTHVDIGKRIGGESDGSTPVKTMVIGSIELFPANVVIHENSARGLKTNLLFNDTVHLWVRDTRNSPKKEFRLKGINGDLIIQAELEEEALRAIYDRTPTIKIEYREVGEWKEYNLG